MNSKSGTSPVAVLQGGAGKCRVKLPLTAYVWRELIHHGHGFGGQLE